jgi:N-acetylneuraminic acid mutarotase
LSRLVAAPSRSGAVLAGGLDAADASTSGVFHLNLSSGALRSVGAVPQPFHDAAAVTLRGRLVVFGGGTQTSSRVVQETGAGGRGSGRVVGRLPQRRSDLSAATVGGRVYLLGGYTGTTELHTILETTDGRSFRTVGRLPLTVRYAATVAVGSTIWVFGGEHGNRPVRYIQAFDTATGAAKVVGKLPAARSEAMAMVLAGHILLAGGRDSSGAASGQIGEFDPRTTSLRSVATLPQPVADSAVMTTGSTAYLIGGEATKSTATVQRIVAKAIPNHPVTG